MILSSARPTGRAGRETRCGTEDRRSRSSTTLRGRSAASDSSNLNFSAQATIGRQKTTLTVTTMTIMTPMAMPTLPRLLWWMAEAT